MLKFYQIENFFLNGWKLMKFFFKVICLIMTALIFACTNDIEETNGNPSTINGLIDFEEVEYFTEVIGQTFYLILITLILMTVRGIFWSHKLFG